MRNNSTLVRILLGLSLVLGAGIALSTPYVNEDLFLAFAAGRDIAQGVVAAPDHWSFTAEGRVWINQAWLSHYLFYATHEYVGPAGPVALKVFLFAGCLILILLRCRRVGADLGTSLVALIPGILACGPFLGIRPENFGLLFFVLFTNLLTADTLSKGARRFAIPVVMVAWANFHGSFMVGLALLGVKCLLVTWRAFRKASHSKAEAAEWWITAALCTILPGVVSPFGIDNLLMPFKQVGTRAITEYSADWLPLLSFGQLDHGFLGGGSVYPYLILLALLTVSGLVSVKYGVRRYLKNVPADVVMEAVVALVTVFMAFRFRRLVLFSALSLVPLLAAFYQSVKEALRHSERSVPISALQTDAESSTGQGPSREGIRPGSAVAPIAAAACLAVMAFLFWRAAVVPYLPGNPFQPERPLIRQLMSFDSFSPSLIKFMRTNGIGETNFGERILAGWELSSYLMEAMPHIRVFMDCRDQSVYPERVATDYFTIMGVIQDRSRDPLALLDDYGVTCVALTTDAIDLEAAIKLMRSRKWACIYADPQSILLVRADSERFKEAIRSDLNGLWFPDEESRTLSRAFLSHFLHGRIPPEVVEHLKADVRRNPWPNFYPIIVWGIDTDGSCYKSQTVNYLISEAVRLNEIDPYRDRRGAWALESLVRIYEILQANALHCGQVERARGFERLKADYQRKYDQLRDQYLGRFF